MRGLVLGTLALAALTPFSLIEPQQAARGVRELAAELSADNPNVRARAACDLREHGSDAAPAADALVALLADGAPVDRTTCAQRWWRGEDSELTTPGELAAAALVAIGSPIVDRVVAAASGPSWIARRYAAWALGALDEARAGPTLLRLLQDREPLVRQQAAWALGAIDHGDAVTPLISVLKDDDPRVRRQAAWALGAIDDPRAVSPVSALMGDADERTRAQAAWALGALDGREGVPALVRGLHDTSPRVRQQSAWALGAIGDSRALNDLMTALKDPEAGVRRQAAWAIGAIGK